MSKHFVDTYCLIPFCSCTQSNSNSEKEEEPFDIPNVELGRYGEEECSFDAIIKKYELDKNEPALLELAKR
jgi:hypothetical protein